MSLELTLLLLLAAVMHAVWNAVVKSSRDPLVELASLNLAAGILCLPLVPALGLPGLASAPYLVGNVFCHSAYYTLLLHSYSAGGLSLVYPIARGAAPLLVTALSALLLREPLGAGALAGVILIAGSVVSLALSGGRRYFRFRAVSFSLATGASIAAYTLVDGAGARAATSALSYIACLFVLDAFVLLPALYLRRRGEALERLLSHWKSGLVSGALSVVAYGIAVWGMTRAPIALVAALRETSVIAAAAIGALFLGEPFGKYRVAAATGVALGIVLLRIAG